jgi:WD40 repeat protein
VAFSSDGKLLYTTSYQSARLWEVATGAERAVLKGIYPIAVSPDVTLVITTSPRHTPRTWQIATATERAVLKGHTDSVTHATFSPDSKLVYSLDGRHGSAVGRDHRR